MAKYKRKLNDGKIDARQIGEKGESLKLEDNGKSSHVFAQEGEWLITESDGRQYVLSDTSFKLQFAPYRHLLLD